MLKRSSNALVLAEGAEWRPISRVAALKAMGAVVYAIRLDGDVIKIGFTKNLAAREMDLRWANQSKSSQVLGFMPGDYEDEQEIHDTLVDHLAHGREYYRPTPEVLAVVNRMRDRFSLPHIAA